MEQKPESSIGSKAKPVNAEEYCSRFDYSHWSQILGIVRHVTGPALCGVMSRFNTADLGVRVSMLFNFDLVNILETNTCLCYIQESNKSTSSFGLIATTSIFKDSLDISRSRFLRTKDAKSHFVSCMDTAGIFACYQILKGVLIKTIEQGFDTPHQNKKRSHTGLIENEREWIEVLTEVKRYAEMLEEGGRAVDLDDLNEGTGGDRRPGLLEIKPAADPPFRTQILKRKGKNAAAKPAKRGKKNSD